MVTIENIITILTLICFIGLIAFGLLASSYVDKSKLGTFSMKEIRLMGPFVSEKVLKVEGVKFAKMRNLCVLLVFIIPILFAANKAFFSPK